MHLPILVILSLIPCQRAETPWPAVQASTPHSAVGEGEWGLGYNMPAPPGVPEEGPLRSGTACGLGGRTWQEGGEGYIISIKLHVEDSHMYSIHYPTLSSSSGATLFLTYSSFKQCNYMVWGWVCEGNVCVWVWVCVCGCGCVCVGGVGVGVWV